MSSPPSVRHVYCIRINIKSLTFFLDFSTADRVKKGFNCITNKIEFENEKNFVFWLLATCIWLLSPVKPKKNQFFLLQYLKILFKMKKRYCHISIRLRPHFFEYLWESATIFWQKMSQYMQINPFYNVLPKENLIMWLHINYNITAVASRWLLMTSGIKQIIFDVAYFKEKLKRVKNDCHTWKVGSVKCKVFYLWN